MDFLLGISTEMKVIGVEERRVKERRIEERRVKEREERRGELKGVVK